MKNAEPYLDAEELVRLAQYEIARQQPAQALIYYKMAAAQEPENGEVKFLLALLHADLGLVPRAITELRGVLDVHPDMRPARLRLGELCMNLGELGEMRSAWRPLQEFEDDNALQAYIKGMLLLAEGDPLGYAEFEAGLRDNSGDKGLLARMYSMLEHAYAEAETPVEGATMSGQIDAPAEFDLGAGGSEAQTISRAMSNHAKLGIDIAASSISDGIHTVAAVAALYRGAE